jgi:glycerophosphoryl diester phosphodiesterase
MLVFTIIIVVLLILGGGILYAMKPSQSTLRKARFKSFENHYIAHRGLHDERYDAPENSMAAFRRAVNCGFGIELDVRLTRDNKLAVIHDDNLSRVCGANVSVSGSDYDELKGYRLGDTNEHIPLLKDVLDEVGGRVPVIIEIKADTVYEDVCRLVAHELNGYEGEVCIQSFSPYVVKWFKDNCSDVLRGQLSMNFFDPRHDNGEPLMVKVLLTFLLTNFLTQPDFVSYEFIEFDSIIMKIMRNIFGVETAGWTMTSYKCIADLSTKFDIVIFEGFMPKEKSNLY